MKIINLLEKTKETLKLGIFTLMNDIIQNEIIINRF